MSTPILPPNPSLIAILLNVRTKAGPSFVFHYPAIPTADRTSTLHRRVGSATAEQSSRSDTLSSGSSDDGAWNSGDDNDIANVSKNRTGRIARGDLFDQNGDSESYGIKGGEDPIISSRRSHFGRISSTERQRQLLGSGPGTIYDDNDDGDGGYDNDSVESDTQVELRKDGSHGVNKGRRSGGTEEGRRRGHIIDEGSYMEWEHLLGFPTSSLEKLLSPQRHFHKKRVEIGLDELVFLGYPIFAKEGGGWKKRRRKKKRHSDAQESLGILIGDGDTDDNADEAEKLRNGDSEMRKEDRKEEQAHADDNVDRRSDNDSEARSTSTSDDVEEMTMFTVVFVLDPPLLEYRVRIMDMYDNVVKKFAKALKYEQARSNYVWHESRKIIEMKEKAKENGTPIHSLWPNIINSSPLAKSIAVVYDSISSSKIAHINLGEVDTSLQIPQAVSTSFLPTPLEPQIPGLWLTTATLIDEDLDITLSPHAALLLLEDADTLIKEVEGDAKELSVPLAYYIRNTTPTKSLKKISAMLSIALEDIEILARHLIYWRRARAIPPLHPRDTYLVSPNADLRSLRKSMLAYSARFPTLPSMPEMLHKLSIAPRPYITLIPSKDHKVAYMEILAFLMRGGWVTQLRTFAWIRVMPEVKFAVSVQPEESDRNDDRSGVADQRSDRLTTPSPSAPSKATADVSDLSPRKASQMTKAADESANFSSVNGKHPSEAITTRPGRNMPALLTKASYPEFQREGGKEGKEKKEERPLETVPKSTKSTSDPSLLAPTLILAPHKANNLESRWMDRIRSTIRDPELRDLWPLWVRYFDGQHALDEIATREGLKRKKVAALLSQLREMGVLLTVRHW